jgi:hypothetical protein
MDDLKSVTVGYLRDLAREHLGSGYSKLKKEELIAALAAYVPALAKLARMAGIAVPRKPAAAKKADGKSTERAKTRTEGASKAKAPAAAKSPSKAAAPKSKAKAAAPAKKAPAAEAPAKKPARQTREQDVGQGRVSAPQRVAAKRASEKPGEATPARPAKVVNFPPKPRSSREAVTEPTPVFMAPMMAASESSGAGAPPSGGSGPSGPSGPSQPEAPPPPEQHAAEPLVEGFFVARVMGEGEARSHHLQGDPPRESEPLDRPEREGGMGELPPVYEDDTTLLLPRDPYTLFASWDLSAATRNRVMQGMDSPRAVLKVFDGEGLMREVDVALESRSYYIHDMPPGRPYRVELHFVGSDGRSRRIGPSSNRILLPSVGPSQDTSIRFLRVPTRMPEPQVIPEPVPPARARVPAPEEREYVTWHRVNLPGSGGFEDLPEVRRERDTPAAPEEQPAPYMEGPPRPAGASDQRYLESMERAPGASDQRYMESVERPAGASDQRYLEAVARPAGASDQRYVQGAGQTGGPSYLDVGRAPGASDMRYLESPGRAAGASDQRYLEAVARPAGASDQRYLESPGRAAGASDMRYLESPGRAAGASDMRYLESPPRAAGASDMRYLDSPGRVAGASDMRYLDSPGRVAGASDMRYLESPGRVSGASDARYLESPPRAAGASDMRYLESPPRATGASDARYLEYVARPPGASDQRYSEAEPSPGGSSEQNPSRKPPSGSGHS